MGIVYYGITPHVLKMGIERECKAFVETGTYRGDTARLAAQIFTEVHTIESNPEYFITAASTTAINSPEVKLAFHRGESPTILRTILPGLPIPVLFWLDAHWMGEGPMPLCECPLLDELVAINESGCRGIIAIDDARLFIDPPPPPHNPAQWPTMAQVRLVLGERHVVICEDVIIATDP